MMVTIFLRRAEYKQSDSSETHLLPKQLKFLLIFNLLNVEQYQSNTATNDCGHFAKINSLRI